MRLGIAESAQYFLAWFRDTSSMPAGLTGLSPAITLKRHADGWFWTGALWQSAVATGTMEQWDSTNVPGAYRFTKPTVTSQTQVTLYVDALRTFGIADRYGLSSVIIDAKVDNLDTAVSTRSTLTTAQVNTEVDTALGDYDAPTKAELDAAVAPLATDTDLDANTLLLRRCLGLGLENFVEDDIVRDSKNNKTSSVLYIYDSAANATLHDKTTGLVASYTYSASHSASLITTQRVVKV